MNPNPTLVDPERTPVQIAVSNEALLARVSEGSKGERRERTSKAWTTRLRSVRRPCSSKGLRKSSETIAVPGISSILACSSLGGWEAYGRGWGRLSKWS